MDNIPVKQKVAVVTGGAGDIGADICSTLLRGNFKVVSLDMHPHPNSDVDSQVCNITHRNEVLTALGDLDVDVLVNAAGITRDQFLHKMDWEDWQNVININLTGTYNVTRAVIGRMRDRNYGRIVNISSVNGARGQFAQCNYSASKAGLHGFTMSLAQEGARKNIMVNTVSPGYIDTKMTKKIPEDISKQIVSMIPAGRMGTPADVTRAVMFLLAESNTYITGANIPVNGALYTSF